MEQPTVLRLGNPEFNDPLTDQSCRPAPEETPSASDRSGSRSVPREAMSTSKTTTVERESFGTATCPNETSKPASGRYR